MGRYVGLRVRFVFLVLLTILPLLGLVVYTYFETRQRTGADVAPNTLALVVAAALLSFVLGSVLIDLLFVRRLRALLQASERLSMGDLTARTGTVRGQNYWNDLSATFNRMAQSLQDRERELRQLNTELEQRTLARTAELQAANQALTNEVAEHARSEEALAHVNESLTTWAGELEQRNQEMALLNQMGDLLQSCRSEEEAYRVVAQSVPQLFPDAAGAVYLISNSRDLTEAVARWGELPEDALEDLFPPDDCWALRRGRIHVIADTQSGMLCAHVAREQARGLAMASYLCVPLIAQSEITGFVYLRNSTQANLEEAKQRLAVSVAEHIAFVLSSLKLRAALQEQAIRDPLTGLFNRRYMTASLEREFHRARRRNSHVGVIVLDLDHFKRLNDQHDHMVGDAVLRSLGHLLASCVRGEDITCRYGGDEFVVILPDTTLAGAQMRAERLRQAIERLDTVYQGQSYGNLSASFGVAVFPEHAPSVDAVLRLADNAMYEAKAQGRNRVVIAGGRGNLEPVA